MARNQGSQQRRKELEIEGKSEFHALSGSTCKIDFIAKHGYLIQRKLKFEIVGKVIPVKYSDLATRKEEIVFIPLGEAMGYLIDENTGLLHIPLLREEVQKETVTVRAWSRYLPAVEKYADVHCYVPEIVIFGNYREEDEDGNEILPVVETQPGKVVKIEAYIDFDPEVKGINQELEFVIDDQARKTGFEVLKDGIKLPQTTASKETIVKVVSKRFRHIERQVVVKITVPSLQVTPSKKLRLKANQEVVLVGSLADVNVPCRWEILDWSPEFGTICTENGTFRAPANINSETVVTVKGSHSDTGKTKSIKITLEPGGTKQLTPDLVHARGEKIELGVQVAELEQIKSLVYKISSGPGKIVDGKYYLPPRNILSPTDVVIKAESKEKLFVFDIKFTVTFPKCKNSACGVLQVNAVTSDFCHVCHEPQTFGAMMASQRP